MVIYIAVSFGTDDMLFVCMCGRIGYMCDTPMKMCIIEGGAFAEVASARAHAHVCIPIDRNISIDTAHTITHINIGPRVHMYIYIIDMLD